ncbi:hypothetical protein LWI28_014703 [Acer negundo]|uniref:Uncharacterized protein n=1 Tax=Acer negundo TaxID=4023 RepID=A0AAD5IQ53_ACENE|nr:hypothetical protein LWI28_014703 [Acer negundo]
MTGEEGCKGWWFRGTFHGGNMEEIHEPNLHWRSGSNIEDCDFYTPLIAENPGRALKLANVRLRDCISYSLTLPLIPFRASNPGIWSKLAENFQVVL